MGKGKKRANSGVGVDFRKVKHKVGKKLPKAQNETRTDFQARSINLPNQSITQDKTGAAVSERNLTLKELVSQLGHHNTSTRRDALTGLQQLTAAHPTEARRHTALLLESLAPRLSDGDASVRTALLATLRSAVLPALGPAALSPFMPLVMAHVSAALTNLSANVRYDALSVLEVVTESAPQLMVQQQQLGAVLAHYLGLLSRANRGKSVKSQALTGLLKVVASLDRFLTAALAANMAGNSGSNANSLTAAAAAAGGCGSFGNSQDGQLLLLQGQRAACAPAAAAQIPSSPAVLLQLYCPAAAPAAADGKPAGKISKQKQQQHAFGGEPSAAAGSGSNDSSKSLEQQVLDLLEVLFDCWSEAAPGTLSTAPDAESAQVLVHILTSAQLIMTHFGPPSNQRSSHSAEAVGSRCSFSAVSASLTSSSALCPGFNTRREQMAWLQKAAGIVLPKLTKAFPVTPPTTRGLGVALYDLLQRFNMLGMQLCSGFMAAGVVWPQQQQQQQQQQGAAGGYGSAVGVLQEWHHRLLEFMAGVLATGNCLPHLEPASAAAAAVAPAAAVPAAAAGRSSGTLGSKALQQQQQQQQQQQSAAPANSSLSSSSILATVLRSLQQLLPHLVGLPRQHILAAVGQLAAAAAVPQSTAAAAGTDSGSGLRVLSPAARGAAGSNAVRSACLRLQLQLMLQHLWRGVPQSSEDADIAAWLAAAPKLLYELGSGKPKISQLLLQLLFEAARLAVPGSVIEQQLQSLQSQLAALLVTALPPPAAAKHTKQQQQQQQGPGSSAQSGSAAVNGQAVWVVVGPLADLPTACQYLAFDTLAHLPQLTPPLLKAVALSCRVTSYQDAAVQRLLDGLLSAAAGGMPPDVFVGFTATLLSPGPVLGYVDRASKGRQQIQAGFKRHQQLADAVCRWLHCYGPVKDLLQLLLGPLLQQWQQQQQGAAGGSQQQQQQQVCCLAYSLLSLAALGAGCWAPSSSSTAASTPAAAAAAEGVEDAKWSHVPAQLLSVLPGVLATYCLRRASSSADAFAAEAAIEQTLQQLVLPLAYALHSRSLLLPFMQQLVQGLSQQQQQVGLRVPLHFLRVLLSQQGLKLVWLQHEGEVQPLLQQLEAAARQVQEQAGDGSALARVEQLQTALTLLCKQ